MKKVPDVKVRASISKDISTKLTEACLEELDARIKREAALQGPPSTAGVKNERETA